MAHFPKTFLKCLAALVFAAALAGCGTSGGVTDPGAKNGPGAFNSPVRSTITLGKVGVLSKTSAITLRKLILTAVSRATPADTVRDTSVVNGSEAVTVRRVLKLKPLVTWTLMAMTLDQKDSVIHAGVSQAFSVQPADTAEVSLSLASRFIMYQAIFSDLPVSIKTSQPGPERAAVNLNRLVLKIDGAVKADSLLPAGYFAGGQNVAVSYDYVTPGTHSVALEAYGLVEGYSGLLFSGTATFSSVAGEDNTKPVTLSWVGPGDGGGAGTIILGRIGRVTLIGGFNPNL